MKNINLLSLALLGAVLTACGGGSGSPSKPDLCAEFGVEKCNEVIIPDASSSSSASSFSPPVNDMLPIVENFNVGSSTEFFNQNYKSLLNINPEDPNNALYYPTAGLDSGNLAVADGKLSIGNARFTIGQQLVTTGTHIDPNAATPPADYKVDTTTSGTAANFATTTTWGDLDLTNPWKISFCVKEWAHLTATANNQLLQVFIDHNRSASGASIHDAASLITAINVENFVPGQRVEINVPGRLFVGGVDKAPILGNRGTTSSFIQLRVPSGAVLTMSELWIGYQADLATEPSAGTCSAGERVAGWGVAIPPADPVGPPALEVGDTQLTVTWAAQARAASYQVAYNTSNSIEGAEVLTGLTGLTTTISGLQNGTEYYVFVRGVNTGGNSVYSPVAMASPQAAAVAPETPADLELTAGNTEIAVTWTAVEGASTYTIAYNTLNSTADATLITGITGTSRIITELSNGMPYYVFVQAVNSAGSSAFTASASATPEEPAPTSWLGENLELFSDGIAGTPASGTITEENDGGTVVLRATGGAMTSDTAFRTFFAHKQFSGQFVFTARIASVEAANGTSFTGPGNSYGYGIMVIDNLEPATPFGALPRFATLNLFTSTATPTFGGSRSHKLSDGEGNRSRSNVDGLGVGHYLRIEVMRDSSAHRVRRYVSTDGVNFGAAINSSSWSTGSTDDWYVGFYAAPGTEDLVITFDNISLEPYVAPIP